MKPSAEQEARAQEAVRRAQLTIDDWLNAQPVAARGETCEADDVPRLNAQCQRVYAALRDLRPHTLADISASCGDPEASVSARIREIRRYLKDGHKGDVLRERVPDGNGLHTYTMRLERYSGAA